MTSPPHRDDRVVTHPGTRVGPYEIVAPLGAGGMGEVYRATDTPGSFALDADLVARFTREAKTLAALNHPNITAIHGIVDLPADRLRQGYGESAGASAKAEGGSPTGALVMELVEGEDLSAHIARGPMPLADALPIARQIAEALEAAHEQGIVHRDLKPANIKMRPDGTDGRELFFRLGGKVLATTMSSAAPLGFSVPAELFGGPYTLDLMGTSARTSPGTGGS